MDPELEMCLAHEDSLLLCQKIRAFQGVDWVFVDILYKVLDNVYEVEKEMTEIAYAIRSLTMPTTASQ